MTTLSNEACCTTDFSPVSLREHFLSAAWSELLRALHDAGFPDPRKIEETPRGELLLEFAAIGRSYLTTDAFIIIPQGQTASTPLHVRALQWMLPPSEVEPGWVAVHDGTLSELPRVLEKCVSIKPRPRANLLSQTAEKIAA